MKFSFGEISIRYTEFEHSPAVIAIVRDITERKRLDAQNSSRYLPLPPMSYASNEVSV
jgi:hypothetical protein